MKAVIYKGTQVIGAVTIENGELKIEGSAQLVKLIERLKNRSENSNLDAEAFLRKLPEHLRSYIYCELEN